MKKIACIGSATMDVMVSPVDEMPPAGTLYAVENTSLLKWGVQGNADTDGKTGEDKIYWQVVITGKKDSFIPGNILTDSWKAIWKHPQSVALRAMSEDEVLRCPFRSKSAEVSDHDQR